MAPDSFRRACLSSTPASDFDDIHKALCHPGVTRMLHFVGSLDAGYVQSSSTSSIAPHLNSDQSHTTYGTTQYGLHGPLSSASRNTYILTIVDEFSRFLFAFPFSNMNSVTVIKCFNQLFTLCGYPSYVHSDCGSSFLSQEVKNYLTQRGVATSKTTAYHPTDNGQVERFNGIIWMAVCLALKSANLPDSQWEQGLPDTLHSIRSLLTTSTNSTPHESFFEFQRCSSYGTSMPSWLMSPGLVLLR